MRTIFIALTILAYMTLFARNIEPLGIEEQKTIAKLEALQWRVELSENEITLVTNSLVSSKDTVAEAALCVAIVHDFSNLQEAFQHGVGPENGYSRLIANVITSGLENEQRPIVSLQRSYLQKNVPLDAKYSIEQKAGHIMAVIGAKMLRKGEMLKIDANEFTFSSFDQKLLLYSEYSEATAKREIIQILAKATMAGAHEYELIQVLESYYNIDLDSILAAFEDEKTGEYGKLLLIRAIENRVYSLSDAERQKAKSVLKKYHDNSKRIKRAIHHVFDQL